MHNLIEAGESSAGDVLVVLLDKHFTASESMKSLAYLVMIILQLMIQLKTHHSKHHSMESDFV